MTKYSLYKRGDIWLVSFYVEGKQQRVTTGCSLKADAEKAAQAIIRGEGRATPKQPSEDATKRLSALFRRAQLTAWVNHKSKSTYDINARNIIRVLGDVEIDTITEETLSKLSDALRLEGKSVATINRHLALLSSLFTVCRRQWGIKVQKPEFVLQKERNARTRILSRAEEVRVIGECPSPIREVVLVLLDTGLRLSELTTISPAMVDYERDCLFIPMTKNDQPRAVPMSDRVRDTMRAWGGVCPLTKEQAEHQWASARKKMGGLDNVVLHTMRHTCATRMIEAGVPIYTIKAWLGHESIETTMRYAKMTPMQLEEAAKMMRKVQSHTHALKLVYDK